MAEISLNLGSDHFSESEKWIQKAIDANTRNGMNYRLGIDYALYGDYFRREGDSIKARNKIGNQNSHPVNCQINPPSQSCHLIT